MARRDDVPPVAGDVRTPTGRAVPDLEPGLTLLERPSGRAPDVHALAIEHLAATEGEVYWIDARDTASTHLLYDLAPHASALADVRIARAWTAYQHHALVRSIVREASDETSLVVVPAVASLYHDDELPDWEAGELHRSAMTILREVSETFDVPVLASAVSGTDASEVSEYADREIRCRKTTFGYAFEGEGVSTPVYWGEGWFQTTIPYWVDLLGRANEDAGIAAEEAGFVPGEV